MKLTKLMSAYILNNYDWKTNIDTGNETKKQYIYGELQNEIVDYMETYEEYISFNNEQKEEFKQQLIILILENRIEILEEFFKLNKGKVSFTREDYNNTEIEKMFKLFKGILTEALIQLRKGRVK